MMQTCQHELSQCAKLSTLLAGRGLLLLLHLVQLLGKLQLHGGQLAA